MNMKLKRNNNDYGVCGKLAPFKDSDGKKLHTGDTVKLYNNDGLRGERSIVEDDEQIFIMGIKYSCPNYKEGGWKIFKNKSYTDMKDGDIIDDIKYEKEGEKKMEKFKVGDRVKFDKSKNKAFLFGETTDKGIVTGISATTNIHVKFSNGNEQYVFPESLELDKPTIEEIFAMPVGTRITTDLKENNIFVKSVDENHFHNGNTFIGKSDLTENLEITDCNCGTKILKIEVPSAYDIVYEAEKEVKEMTMEEISKVLGYEVKIIKEEK